jgi:acyl-coenzyme A synthetase/AMP-(fatty) acid ligase
VRKELLGHARKRLGAAVAPKEIDFRTNLPRTRSGKIMRRLLKARELGCRRALFGAWAAEGTGRSLDPR